MSSTAAIINPLVGQAVSEKLAKGNYQLWKMQVLAAVRGVRLEGYLTGAAAAPATTIKDKDVDVPNPAWEDWKTTDQQVLGFLLSSMTKEALTQVAACKTATETWKVIETIYSSMTKARSINTRIALATTKKGDLTIAEYVGKMRALGDEMANSGKPIDDDELISYIITGLDYDYNPVITSLVARADPLTIGEVYSQLLSYEQRLDLLRESDSYSVNAATRGRGSSRGRSGNRGGGSRDSRGRGRGGSQSRQIGIGNRNAPQQDSRPKCQLCGKRGHLVMKCWHRFDENFVPNEKYAGAAATSYGADSNWYVDTGATDHITGDLERLAVHDQYRGHDQIHTASGAGMNISRIGYSTVPTHNRDLKLNNILYVPQVTKNLVSVHKLATDNSAFLEFHPNFFVIKDQATKRPLLKGRCHKGLYPLPLTSSKQTY